MNVNRGNIYEILNGVKQFILPIYQRSYSWDIEQCETLWNDIVKMQNENKESHFVGSIVNIAEKAMPTGVQKFMLIDGQQRLTTLSLLMIALRNHLQETECTAKVDASRIDRAMLKNSGEDGEDEYKLILTGADKDVFIHLVSKNETKLLNVHSKLLENYNFFKGKIEANVGIIDKIYEATGKLSLVNITLERGSDDAQAIFESLNSTGKGLTASDLVRNYVLMGLEPKQQNTIYESLWEPMEGLFEYDNKSFQQDRFLRDYLTMKLGRIPRQNMVYEEFKRFASNSTYEEVKQLCTDIKNHALYYTNIIYKRSSNDTLRHLYEEIDDLRMEVSFPFLMHIHHSHSNQKITESELIEIIRLCVNYVFRRSICGIPTNSLNKTFATFKNQIREDDYLNSVKAAFVLLDSYKEFPTEEKFKEAFVARDLYHTRTLSYILKSIEDFGNKAPIQIENYTIEHIMPQNPNLSKEWRAELGDNWKEIHKAKLHTIGNLTLTAYNTEMSDKPFGDKMGMKGGFKESALRLNSYVVKQENWTLAQIEERANLLASEAIKIWGYPAIAENVLQQYQTVKGETPQYDLDSYDFNEHTSLLFRLLEEQIVNLSSDIKRDCKKLYIAYKAETNVVDVIVQQKALRLAINMKYSEISDPHHICQDVSELGRWGNGEASITYSDPSQLPNIMEIVKQSYLKQADSE